MKLICLPYAGGTASVFAQLKDLLKNEMEVESIEYRGHGFKRGEPFYTTFDDMVQDVAEQVNMLASETFILFGYSMGAVVAYELLAQGRLRRQPAGVMLISHEAPDGNWESQTYYRETDASFFDRVQQMGGLKNVSKEQLENRFFRMMFFEPLRKDYRLLAGYRCTGSYQVQCPCTILYSPNDIKREKIERWKLFTKCDPRIRALGPDHFLLRGEPEAVVSEVHRLIKTYNIR